MAINYLHISINEKHPTIISTLLWQINKPLNTYDTNYIILVSQLYVLFPYN